MNDYMNDYIVIATPLGQAMPEIVLHTQNEEQARAEAHQMLRITLRDTQVLNLYNHRCELALSPEPEDH